MVIHSPVMPFFCIVRDTGSWKFTLALGLIAIVIGALLFLFAEEALVVIIYLFGFIAIAIAVILLAGALRTSRSRSGVSLISLVFGIVALIIGLVSFFNPAIIGAFFAVLFAIIAMIAGLVVVFSSAFSTRSPSLRALGVLGGILLLAIGVSILLYTEITAAFIVQLIGLLLIAGGIIAIIVPWFPVIARDIVRGFDQ
jgi:uncharacterized membrane protein HdeD (DUF308 family)